MKFALIGDDPEILPLLREIADDEHRRLVASSLAGSLEPTIRSIAPEAQISPRWDALLTASAIDAVLVCGANADVLEAAKQLASAGKWLLILPRIAQTSTWIYELSLIRDEGRTRISPLFAPRTLPIFQWARKCLAEKQLGRPLYLRIDRELAAGTDATATLLSKSVFEDALLHDADLLRSLGGDYGRVTAGHSGAVGDDVAAAAATLSGESLPEATWMARATSGQSRWELTVAGESGQIAVTAIGDSPEWAVRSERVPISEELKSSLSASEGKALLQSIEQLANEPDAAGWTDLVRAFEVIDAARVSVRRRRAVDLRAETASERNLFKSQMTALGCLTLILTLVGVLFLLLLMPLLDSRSRVQIEAERADTLLRQSEFVPQRADLNEVGAEHVHEIARKMGGAHVRVLIEGSDQPNERGLDDKRRDLVVGSLKQQGIADAGERTQVGRVAGEWYPQMLRIVRVLVFLPLALFLVLQAFVVLTRPSAR